MGRTHSTKSNDNLSLHSTFDRAIGRKYLLQHLIRYLISKGSLRSEALPLMNSCCSMEPGSPLTDLALGTLGGAARAAPAPPRWAHTYGRGDRCPAGPGATERAGNADRRTDWRRWRCNAAGGLAARLVVNGRHVSASSTQT